MTGTSVGLWFGEIPFEIEVIIAAWNRADLFLYIGTSGLVYPAAGFAHHTARRKECRLIELNIDQTEISGYFYKQIIGTASMELPKLVDFILRGK